MGIFPLPPTTVMPAPTASDPTPSPSAARTTKMGTLRMGLFRGPRHGTPCRVVYGTSGTPIAVILHLDGGRTKSCKIHSVVKATSRTLTVRVRNNANFKHLISVLFDRASAK